MYPRLSARNPLPVHCVALRRTEKRESADCTAVQDFCRGKEGTSLKCFGQAGGEARRGEEMGRRKVEVEVKQCQGNHFFRCNQQENCPSRVPQEEKARSRPGPTGSLLIWDFDLNAAKGLRMGWQEAEKWNDYT